MDNDDCKICAPQDFANLATWAFTECGDQRAFETVRLLIKDNIKCVRYMNEGVTSDQQALHLFSEFKDIHEFHEAVNKCLPVALNAEQILELIDELDYHCCEHPMWDASPANRWLSRIEEEAERRVKE